jgi:hypothetical protein
VSRIGILDAQSLRFFFNVFHAIAGIRMVAHPLRPGPSAFLLEAAKHVRHVVRIVTGGSHDLGAFDIRLLFVLARESQERRAEPELRYAGDDLAPAAANDRSRDLTQDRSCLVLSGFAGLRRAVAQRHVTQFMRHDAGDFAFGCGGFDHAAIDEGRPARQGRGVDVADIDHFE